MSTSTSGAELRLFFIITSHGKAKKTMNDKSKNKLKI
jgi:hypothetical protein